MIHRSAPRTRRGLLLALVAVACLLTLSGRAAAQCTEEPCGPVDYASPVITLSPASGTYAAGVQTVTITWSDEYALNHNSRVIMYDTANVTGGFSYTTSTGGTAQSTGQVTVGPGSRTLTAYICDMSAYGPNCASQAVTYTGAAAPGGSASVTAETPTAVVAGGSRGALRYRVTNTGAASGTFSLNTVCSAGFAPCTPSDTSVTLAAGASAWVDVGFPTPASGSGMVRLTTLGGSVVGATTVTVPPTPAPGYPGDSLSLLRIQRDACVVVATGPGTASECGDLRVAHALPSVRVLNRTRTPVLTYTSDHAWPNPVVAAQFAGPPGTVPDSIRAVLTVNGTQVAQRRWRGWGADQTRRIALSFPANDTVLYRTGLYSYSLVVTAEWLNGTQTPVAGASRGGRMIIVNRSASPFGAGWWLSGVEQVFPLGDTLNLWVGGDGSARLYRGTSAAGWAADAYDGVDSLTRGAGGTGYVRLLPGGAKVHFDGQGYHIRTENALGHVTQFVWTPGASPAEKRLASLVLPSGPGHPETLDYLFEYGAPAAGCTTSPATLSRVRSPAAAGGYQDTRLCGDNLRRVTRIDDPAPDSAFVTFGYYQGTRWMTRRTDRRGVAQTMGYSRVRFHSATQPLSAGVNAVTTVAAAQTLGMNGVSVNADSVHVVYDGPRPGDEVCDCVWWKVDRWGSPTSIRGILGQVTTVRRGDGRFPGLVTETVAPNGFRTTARYDAQGYLASSTAWDPYGDARNATTLFEWDAAAAAPVRILSPEGELALTGYDAMRRRAWEQVGPDSARRVRYRYYDASHPAAPGLVRAVVPPALPGAPGVAGDSIEYDARGNAAAAIGPLRTRTEFLSDRLGRVVRTRVPVDSAHTLWQQDSTIYDDAGRVRETIATGPAADDEPRQWLHVRNHYDREDNVEMVERWSVPDAADVDIIRTRWEYDLGGRPVMELAPDTTPGTWADNPRDSTFYDRAGNVVRVRTRRFAESLAATPDSAALAYVRMEYDALNRLNRRILPAVRYAPRFGGMMSQARPGVSIRQPYPYDFDGSSTGMLIPADTSDFAYHPVSGVQEHASNANARVRRVYYPNGQLRYDSLYTRTVATGDLGTHRYGLEYRYDRSGRMREMRHPSQLLPPAARLRGEMGNRYGYDAVTGGLHSVRDPLGNEFRYHYNVRGEPDSLVLPGRIRHEYAFNAGGQLQNHRITNAATGGYRYGDTVLRDESLAYDPRGKLVAARNTRGLRDVLDVTYSGLGHLRSSTHTYWGWSLDTGQETSYTVGESPVHDALGNLVSINRTGALQVYGSGFMEASHGRDTYTNGALGYEPHTGRLRERSEPGQDQFTTYDAGGNAVFMTGGPRGTDAGELHDRASFYDGGGRQWAVDVRRVENGAARSPLYVTLEEYRLDALGRRVLVRTRRTCSATLDDRRCSLSSVRRTIWAGDQELYEIQMPDEYGENDVDSLPAEGRYESGFDPNLFWGRVGYTFGGGLDRPLSIVRMGYSNVHPTLGLYRWPEFALVPHWDAHGRAQSGTFHDGAKDRCRVSYVDRAGYQNQCVQVEWADGIFPYSPAPQALEHWHGTLLTEKRDASGLLYRRNRYYDPVAGRFTQEDPIGLAGGVNVYGFAAGDPVNYSDPYGLCPFWMMPWPSHCRAFDNLRPSEQRWTLRNMWKAERAAEITAQVYWDLNVLDVFYARYRGSGHNTPIDAMRHAILSCRLTIEFGSRTAQEITDAHEGPHKDGSVDPEVERNMDLHNNTVGRQMARQTSDPGNCWGLAVNADMAGALSIINDNGITHSQR